MPSGLSVGAWEARVLRKLDDHPNIARVHDYWEDDEAAVMVIRYLDGERLEDLIAHINETTSRLTVQHIFRLSTEIASGLAYIHQRRILYRDLQPHNVLLDDWGTAHLVDFATAASLDDNDISDLSHRPVIEHMAPDLMRLQDAA